MAGFTLSPTITRSVPQDIAMDLLRLRQINWRTQDRVIDVFLDIGFTAGGPEFFPLTESYSVRSVAAPTNAVTNDISSTIPSGDHVTDFETNVTPDNALLSDMDQAIFETLDNMGYFDGAVIP